METRSRIRLSAPCSRAIALFAIAVATLPAHAVAQEPVAIVTEIAGSVQVQSERPAALKLLSALGEGTRLDVRSGTKLTVLYLNGANQFRVSGPAVVTVGAEALGAEQGAEPQRLKPIIGKDGAPLPVRPPRLMPASPEVRNGPGKPIAALSVADTITLEQHPVFRWREVERDLEYQFTLKDAAGTTLLRQNVRGERLQLPPEITLEPGATYAWAIGTRAGMGQNYLSAYSFRLADDAMRARVANFRPVARVEMAEDVAFAVWLDEIGLRDAATAWWTKIDENGGPRPSLRPAPDALSP